MRVLNSIDYTVIIVYFAILIGLGIYLQKKASQSLEDYFLGGRNLPWWALGLSGMASWLDITGTMIITSFLFLMGPRGLFIEFRGGAVLIAAVIMLWAGKWHRRSGCITGAEWMHFRFGSGWGGNFARLAMAVAQIIFTIGMVTYMIRGVSLFLSMFLPLTPFWCAVIMIGVATIYTMASGFYGVVYTDVFQSGIILIAVLSISIMAALKVPDAESISNIAQEITSNKNWASSVPSMQTSMPKGYEAYESLFMFAVFYLFRNVFGGFGEGAEPKYFGARSDKECGTLTFLTVWTIMFRWPMMIGFAILGIFLVKDLFPDQSVLTETSVMIKEHVGNVTPGAWADVIGNIMNHPENYSQDFIDKLHNMLGENWRTKLHLVSYHGTVNAERILPAVLLFKIPMGLRGALLVALIAASMSTFDTMVNLGAGFFTRDIYQRYLRPAAKNKELILITYTFILATVVISFVGYYSVDNINDIWGWVMMGLGGGMLIPKVLRFYWWRYNGAGFAIGMFCGAFGAVLQRLFIPEMDERLQFIIMVLLGLAGSIVGTYMFPPTDKKTLTRFYRITKPFGFWGPLVHTLAKDEQKEMFKEHKQDLSALPFALGWQITLFLLPMQIIIHAWKSVLVTGTIFAISLTGLYVIWLRNLNKRKSNTEVPVQDTMGKMTRK